MRKLVRRPPPISHLVGLRKHRAAVEGMPPWAAVEGMPPWVVVEGMPPWAAVEGMPPWVAVEGMPPSAAASRLQPGMAPELPRVSGKACKVGASRRHA